MCALDLHVEHKNIAHCRCGTCKHVLLKNSFTNNACKDSNAASSSQPPIKHF
jgi:hypothetical protein